VIFKRFLDSWFLSNLMMTKVNYESSGQQLLQAKYRKYCPNFQVIEIGCIDNQLDMFIYKYF